MKRALLFFITLLLLVPVAFMQETPMIRAEITGVNASSLPTIIVTTSVYDRLGQPVYGLTAENFVLTGELADRAQIVSVENITDDNLSFGVVLAIDVSSSMLDLPLVRAKEAAASFVNQIKPNDPVAIMTFGSTVQLVQDFTTDKAVLLQAIDSLQAGGKTALYQGAFEAVDQGANLPSPRRAVILLSDGAEYGNLSKVGRGAALEEALAKGVPVFTIGLGYGTDRTYLQQLATGTNTRFYESPTPDELLSIYTELATVFRSQYVITVTADVPADGTEYDLGVEVTTDAGKASASAVVRAPIPTPIVSLPDLPTEPISEPTTVTGEVRADDPLTSAEFQVDGTSAGVLTEPPFTVTLDPAVLQPGEHTLTLNITDETGDVGSVSQPFQVAALPPIITLSGLPTNAISEPQTVTLDVTGQTPAVSASYSIDGVNPTLSTEAPYSFTIDPVTLPPGEHMLAVDVTNTGGATAAVRQPFTVAALAPVVTISGLENGQLVETPTEITIETSGQTPVNQLTAVLGGAEVASVPEAQTSVTVDPVTLQPGANRLSVTATNEGGQSTTAAVDFEVAALPPQITITGLQAGQTLEANAAVSVAVTSQTAVDQVAYRVDGDELAVQTEPPFELELDVLELGPGPHILSVQATNAGGQSAAADVAFMVSEGPSLTATALVPTSTPIPSLTFTPSPSLTATIDRTATAEQVGLLRAQQATGTANAEAALNITATVNAQSTLDAQVIVVMTQDTVSASQARATVNAQASADAQATADAQAAADAQATQNAQATTDMRATANAQATVNAQATANAVMLAAQATRDAEASLTAVVRNNEQATLDVQATQTARASLSAEARANAQATQNAQATVNAQATANAVALNAQATQNAQATLDAQAAEASLTAAARANVQATQNAQATLNAQTTLNAQLSVAQATRDAEATMTAEIVMHTQATRDAAVTLTARAQTARDNRATDAAEATLTAQAEETEVEETASAEPTEEVTEAVTQAAPTKEPTEVAQLAASATGTQAREDRTPSPTLTPRGTLVVEQQGQSAPSNNILPILVLIVVIIVLLMLLFLFLRGRRTNTR